MPLAAAYVKVVLAIWLAVLFSLFGVAVFILQRSTVRVAAIEGFLMIEEKSRLYNRSIELAPEQIKQVKIIENKGNLNLIVITKDESSYFMPKASRAEFRWIESEIRHRVLKQRSASDTQEGWSETDKTISFDH